MATKRFSEKDIHQLLQHYRGERRRLAYQLEGVKKAAIPAPPARSRSALSLIHI